MTGPSGRTTVSDRRLIRLAWVATALATVVGIGAVGWLFVPTRPGVPSADVTPIQVIANGTFLLVTPVLALIIIRAQPRSPIGWLFMAFPLLCITSPSACSLMPVCGVGNQRNACGPG